MLAPLCVEKLKVSNVLTNNILTTGWIYKVFIHKLRTRKQYKFDNLLDK